MLSGDTSSGFALINPLTASHKPGIVRWYSGSASVNPHVLSWSCMRRKGSSSIVQKNRTSGLQGQIRIGKDNCSQAKGLYTLDAPVVAVLLQQLVAVEKARVKA